MPTKMLLKRTFFIIVMVLLSNCVKSKNFDVPDSDCPSDLVANITYGELKDMYLDGTLLIQDELVIEGYVVSSDAAGNFFGFLHIQDRPTNPTEGMQIAIDLRDSHVFYPVGAKIYVNLKGLYLGKNKGLFKLGGVFTAFGNASVGPLPAAMVDHHIVVSCDAKMAIEPSKILIGDLSEDYVNTLVSLQDVEILEEELGQSFALPTEETKRTLTDCNDKTLMLLNSGYADFQSDLLPDGQGTISGVLLWEKDVYQLVIRSLEDIDFSRARCADFVDEFSSNQIFISELADPDNNAKARFVELYNANKDPLSLKGWRLRRYTNANLEPSSTIDLSDFTINAESTFTISPNATEFESVYGFVPDMAVGINSPADSNGDDTLELVDPFGMVIDVFGIVGEDGTGTNHEFEDGRAVRKPEINLANPSYAFSEWSVFNDTGGSETIQLPQIAPEDFSPGVRN